MPNTTSPIQYPLINGFRHSFVSIKLKLNGNDCLAFKSLNYSSSRTRSKPYGRHPDPLGKTRGTNEYKCDAEIYLAEFHKFLVDELGAGYGDRQFPIYVTHDEEGSDLIEDVIYGCTIDSIDASHSQGSDATARKIDFGPTKIKFSGLDDLAEPLTAPR